jgi:hypothetical protein
VQFSSVLPSGASEPIGFNAELRHDHASGRLHLHAGRLQQDGKAAGQLNNVSVGTDGLITATFSDGTTSKLGKIMIANFANPNGLRQLGDSAGDRPAFRATRSSARRAPVRPASSSRARSSRPMSTSPRNSSR